MKFVPKKLAYKEFIKVYNVVPRFCIDIIVRKQRGILLTKRDIEPAKGKWHFPGGTVLFKERLIDAANRISKDEIGTKVKIEKVLGIMDVFPPSVIGHTISVAFLCKPLSNELVGGDQGKEIKFFSKIPKNIIREQRDFLIKSKLLKE